ncbi:MAG: thiopeptide-type bacteriocin biosynthesis protein [Minisyncoccia bacterium]
MNSDYKDNWLCLFIFVKPPFEKILTECLYPIIWNLSSKHFIDKFFFIRYGEGGAHIRFRILFKNFKYLSLSNARITDNILRYITLNNLECSSASSKYITVNIYEPEFDRYGGRDGIEIAEKIFNKSSDTVLQILKLTKSWNYNSALFISALMNYTMIYSFVKNNNIVTLLFLFNYNKWLSKRYNRTNRHLTLHELNIETQKLFNNKFLLIKKQFSPMIKYYHSQLRSQTMKDPIFSSWVQDITLLGEELSQLFANGKLVTDRSVKEKTLVLWNIYDSYIHMNNNRLGIRNSDESYISYLLYCSIKTIEEDGK